MFCITVYNDFETLTSDPQHARRFYLGQWIRDAQITCEQLVKNPPKAPATRAEGDEGAEEEGDKVQHQEKVRDKGRFVF